MATSLSHLDLLEVEIIFILREAASSTA